jgi:hypothetical protein
LLLAPLVARCQFFIGDHYMRKSVVYLLGAGFSAPLGIPTMSNFMAKARQLKRGHPEFAYFDDVITLVHTTVSATTFFHHDSDNIEQALSLLEMKDVLEVGKPNAKLIQFIVDVIDRSTREMPLFDPAKMAANRWSDVFTADIVWPGYCSFVASLAGLCFRDVTRQGTRRIAVEKTPNDINYSVLSLNYDLVLEKVCQFLERSYRWEPIRRIGSAPNASASDEQVWPTIVKLHGSIDTRDIIPPTFNKGLYGSDLPESWRQAYHMLQHANEIRVIGYSLPLTDSYIKYLLMASVDKLKDLDRIDWITTDSGNVMTERLRQFLSFKDKYIAKSDVSSYLNAVLVHATHPAQSSGNAEVLFDKLEHAHEEFMNSYGAKIA